MKIRALPVLCFSAALVMFTACSSKPSNLTVNQTASSGQVVGAGSTFVYPEMSRWIEDYQRNHPGVQINYQSIGSGGGIQQLKQGVVNFGASDLALDDAS